MMLNQKRQKARKAREEKADVVSFSVGLANQEASQAEREWNNVTTNKIWLGVYATALTEAAR
jgi:hypothetical protein